MSLPITSLYAAALSPVFLILAARVIMMRAALKVGFGDGGSTELQQRLRQHGNFIEVVPFALILSALAEAGGAGAVWLHVAGLLLLAGRLVHPFGMNVAAPAHPLRVAGASAGFAAIAILGIALGRAALGL